MDGKRNRHKPRRHVTSADEYIRQIKKLVEDYEKRFGSLPKPIELPEPAEKAYRLSQGIGFHDYDEEPCAVRSFMQAHPDHKGPIWIACPCRRCSVWC